MLRYFSKSFDELSGSEVYEILKARMSVFMIGQGIICQDADDTDRIARHLFFADEQGRIAAYLRMYPSGGEGPGTVRIGRVLAIPKRCGLGSRLMEKAVAEAFGSGEGEGPAEVISVEAQVRAAGFYEKLGFRAVSDEFLDEGVPHIRMILEKTVPDMAPVSGESGKH